MLKASEELYEDALHFQNERKEVMDAYEKTIADLQDKKGSTYYTKTLAVAKSTRDNALKELRAKYGEYINNDLKRMQETNNKRGTAAPTDDELRTLNALKMREHITESELSLIANSVKHNALALSVVQEVANKNGILRNYSARYDGKEMPPEYVNDDISGLTNELKEFLQYDTRHAARLAAEYNARHAGVPVPENLPKRNLFTTKEQFYADIGGIKGNNLEKFCNAVDGETSTEQ